MQRPEVKQFQEKYRQEALKDEQRQKRNSKVKLLLPFILALLGFVIANPFSYELTVTLGWTLGGFLGGIGFLFLLSLNPISSKLAKQERKRALVEKSKEPE